MFRFEVNSQNRFPHRFNYSCLARSKKIPTNSDIGCVRARMSEPEQVGEREKERGWERDGMCIMLRMNIYNGMACMSFKYTSERTDWPVFLLFIFVFDVYKLSLHRVYWPSPSFSICDFHICCFYIMPSMWFVCVCFLSSFHAHFEWNPLRSQRLHKNSCCMACFSVFFGFI